MDPITQRWDAYEKERRFGNPVLQDPTVITPVAGGVRIRREYGARDGINSRAWDHFHATPPTVVSSQNLHQDTRNPKYMDMNPICSRTNTVQYRNQPEYMPASTNSTPPNTLSTNPYTQRLDAGGSDARNILRELRSAVTEDNREQDVATDRLLAQRQFYDRWLPAAASADAASLQAYELLRPKQDDWRKGNA
jgi:hypothetical protein